MRDALADRGKGERLADRRGDQLVDRRIGEGLALEEQPYLRNRAPRIPLRARLGKGCGGDENEDYGEDPDTHQKL